MSVALAGMASLAVAMGIGRFAFTPLMPIMLAEGSIDLRQASWLASTNYLAYLIGALLCTVQPWIWSRFHGLPALGYAGLVRGALFATAIVTAAMALPLPGTWAALRFAAGVASALALVFTAGWSLSRLARAGRPALGGVVFAGPGVGIIGSGLLGTGLVAWDWSAAAGWLGLAVLALTLTLAVRGVFRGGDERLAGLRSHEPLSAREAAAAPRFGMEAVLHALAYGLAGFGYIITATFLPVIARAAIPQSALIDLFWPLFGAGVVAGALAATRIGANHDRRSVLAAAYAVQAVGVATSLWLPNAFGFAFGSLLVGFPFTAITFFAMQEARRLRGGTAASYMGLLTASYGIGQVVGPALVAMLVARSASPAAGFTSALMLAVAALVAGMVLYLAMARARPLRVKPTP